MKKYSKEEAKIEIEKLVEFYNENKSKSGIDETVIRNKFINRFFTYLNWDISNEEMRALNEQYVYEEERIAMNGNKKMPDYTFCDGDGGINNRAFFVEAKKPSLNLERDLDAPFQLRSYGYSARLFISVLTNFEQLAIYNTYNIEPIKHDQPTKARLRLINCADYSRYFDEIWNLLEFNNVQEGSIREYVANLGIISDTQKPSKDNITVDESFLMLIEDWRKKLAQGVFLRSENSFMNTNKEQVNYAVQKIIDRIIFLRIIEDRGLEEYGNLRTIAKNYKSLCKYFVYADEKYNSGLFHFSENIDRGIHDTITQKLHIVDDKITEIVESLYDKEPYKFDVMPAYILGSVYERFLGKEINVGNNNSKNKLINETVSIDLKPDVRKAGGVFYTPEYIVNYIIANTVTANEEATILDSACGSGSFLLVAYQYMLDFYQKKSPYKKLTLQQRKDILLKHIYGVDLDEQAVEVAKLSLLLKVLEGISKEEIESTRRKNLHALPSLHNNIKCGDSLIDDKTVSEKAFNWEEEFPTVCGILGGKGGFDFVVGNPPYVSIRTLTKSFKPELKNYYSENYISAFKGYDLYVLFFEKGISLLKDKGKLGLITPNKYCTLDYGEKLRKLIIDNHSLIEIVDVSQLKIFPETSVYPYLTFIKKKFDKNNIVKIKVCNDIKKLQKLKPKAKLPQTIFNDNNGYNISLHKTENEKKFDLFLNDICKVQAGTTGFMATATQECIKDNTKKGIDFIVTGNIDRFSIKLGNVRYMNEKYQKPKLVFNSKIITDGKWELYNSPKIVVGGMTKVLEAAFDEEGVAVGVGVYCLTDFNENPFYIIGILNSKFATYYFRKHFEAKHLAGNYLAINASQLKRIPFPTNPDRKKQNQIIKLVEQIMELKKENKNTLRFELKIDEIVYELYGLTNEEINIIDGVK